ncbi:MAG: type I-E CRISPR-associated endonuclease Cas1 [Clostridiales bacterium]|nr:type I-E CRISPR-associated endonuclease Cas1 [Clostridiales bacterium]
MNEIPGMEKPSIQELPQIGDRLSFLYLEHCQISREDSAILVRDTNGTVRIPAAAISTLLLGPGTNLTHRAIELIGDAGVGIVWVGENGVRFYASGRPLTHRSHLLVRQAELVSNQRWHLQVVRKMYQIRFPDEDTSGLTTQQLRGREGSRVRKAYKAASEKWGIKWNGRNYDPNNFSGGDSVNQALSAGNACLYGLAHAVITALGCSPGLGFIHVGHECSFVYDIADLYKAEITIPIAFEIAAADPEDLPGEVRRRVRDEIASTHLLERMVKDIRFLLLKEDEKEKNIPEVDVTYLWDTKKGIVANGRSYSENGEE